MNLTYAWVVKIPKTSGPRLVVYIYISYPVRTHIPADITFDYYQISINHKKDPIPPRLPNHPTPTIPALTMRLVLSRLQPSDFDASIPSQFAAFVHDGGHLAMLGANSAANVARAKTALLGDYAADASNVWIKVSDADAGDRFVAASNWKVYPTYVKGEVDARAREMAALRAEDVGWFEGEREKEDAAVLTREFYEIRYRFTREAHVCKSRLVFGFCSCVCYVLSMRVW